MDALVLQAKSFIFFFYFLFFYFVGFFRANGFIDFDMVKAKMEEVIILFYIIFIVDSFGG